ncbi:MAG: DUF456 domain-containing protein [Spartobacteria bacterium]|nr:DUF456 domain-containing protein [Spartobacteria bacterium]
MSAFFHQAALWAGVALVWILCLTGVGLSAVSFSGTWVVAGAAALLTLISRTGFPGWWMVALFLLISAAAEVFETLAGAWGVKKRGGSNRAGLAALVGGLAGMVIGGFLIPVLLLGSLIGMMAGSFAAAFLVERNRLRHDGQAASIAWGAVMARILVILFKLGATLGMIVYLAIGAWMK